MKDDMGIINLPLPKPTSIYAASNVDNWLYLNIQISELKTTTGTFSRIASLMVGNWYTASGHEIYEVRLAYTSGANDCNLLAYEINGEHVNYLLYRHHEFTPLANLCPVTPLI